jgi:hypothetical protein
LIAAAVQDLFKLFTGGESVIGKALGPEGAKDMKAVLAELGTAFKTVLKDLAPVLADLLKAIAPLIPIIAKILAFVGKVLVKAIKLVIGGFKAVGRVVRDIGKAAGDVVDFIKAGWSGLVAGMRAGVETVLEPIRLIKAAFVAVINFVRAIWQKAMDFLFRQLERFQNFAIRTANRITKLFGLDIEKGMRELRKKTRLRAAKVAPAPEIAQPTGAGRAAIAAAAAATPKAPPPPAINVTANNVNNISGAGLNSEELAQRVTQLSETSQRRMQAEQLRQAMADIKP